MQKSFVFRVFAMFCIILLGYGILIFGAQTPVYAWDNNGGDHLGADWTISTNTTIAGTHTNIGNMTVNSGVVLTLMGDTSVQANGTLSLLGTSIMYTNSVNNGALVGGIWQGRGVTVSAGNVSIASGARIDGIGRGYQGATCGTCYAAGVGPGGGWTNINPSGGSHGGLGRLGERPGGVGPTYGSATAPLDLGSSAGTRYAQPQGRSGGGAIRLVVGGTLTLDGLITMDGENGRSNRDDGGGAGGSIWVTTGTLTGSGSFSAKGGTGSNQVGPDGAACGAECGGAGGGGRISVIYNTETFTTDPTAATSTAGGFGYQGQAGNGSVVFTTQESLLVKAFHTQLKTNGQPIGIGGTTDETSIVLGLWSSSNTTSSETQKIEIEVKPVGTDFDGTGTVTSGTYTHLATTPVLNMVTVSGLTSGSYHWQGRILDASNNVIKNWTSYPYSPSNSESTADFIVGASYSNSGVYSNITVDTNWTFPLPATTKTYYYNSVTVTGSSILTLDGDSTLQLSGALSLQGTSIMYTNSVNNTALVGGTWQGRGVTINAGSVDIASGARIDGIGKGYQGATCDTCYANGVGPGGGTTNINASGGSYGGLGHVGERPGTVGPTYGSATAPLDLGSSAGTRYGQPSGRSGGGAVRITVSGTFQLDGLITMDGENGRSNRDDGGGAGGSIWVTAGTLTGSGSFSAKGGTGSSQVGPDGAACAAECGGAGGGGRVAVFFETESLNTDPTTATSTAGGFGYQGQAGDGTVVFAANPLHKVINLTGGLRAFLTTDEGIDMTLDANRSDQYLSVRFALTSGYRFAEVTHNFGAAHIDMTGVTADASEAEFKSVMNGFTTPHALLVYKLAGHDRVRICPSATTLAQATKTCSGGTTYQNGDPNVSIVTIGGKDYWRIDNLTTTGGVSFQQSQAPSVQTIQLYTFDGASSITTGAWIGENQISFRGDIDDPDSNPVQLEIERRLVGTAFTNTATDTYASIDPSINYAATITGLGDGSYHAQYRVCDEDQCTAWTSYGGNSEASRDFGIDTTNPSGGSISYSDGSATNPSITITINYGTDAASGVNNGAVVLQRSVRPQTDGVCSGTGSFTTIATDPGSSYTDTDVSVGSCYQYQLVVEDTVGNIRTYTNANEAILLDIPEATGVTFSATNDGSGLTIGDWLSDLFFYLKCTIIDEDSPTATIEMEIQPIGTSFTNTRTHYSTINTGVEQTISVTGLAEGSYHFQFRACDGDNCQSWTSVGGNDEGERDLGFDESPPASGNITYGGGFTGGTITTNSIDLTFLFGNDVVSGINTSQIYLQRAQQIVVSGNCAGTWVFTNLAQVTELFYNDPNLDNKTCYHYRLRVVDNAGNIRYYEIGQPIMVEIPDPITPTPTPSEEPTPTVAPGGTPSRTPGQGGQGGTANCNDPLDTDCDGMPDAWELENGFDVGLDDATLDQDGDGFSNLMEFLAKTNPLDAFSIPDSSGTPTPIPSVSPSPTPLTETPQEGLLNGTLRSIGSFMSSLSPDVNISPRTVNSLIFTASAVAVAASASVVLPYAWMFMQNNILGGLSTSSLVALTMTKGMVYDSRSKRRIVRAILRVFEADTHRLVRTIVTSAHGSFQLSLPPGSYVLTAKHVDYSFPSTVVKGKADPPWEHVYHGETFSVNKRKLIELAIPLDRHEKHPLLVVLWRRVTSALWSLLLVMQPIILGVGIVYALWMFSTYRQTGDLIIIVMYLALIVLSRFTRKYREQPTGKVIDRDGKPVANVSVAIYEADFDQMIARVFTDEQGRYQFVVPKNRYYIRITDPQYQIVNTSKHLRFEGIEVESQPNPEQEFVIARTIEVNHR